jgi:hypothetical protein
MRNETKLSVGTRLNREFISPYGERAKENYLCR